MKTKRTALSWLLTSVGFLTVGAFLAACVVSASWGAMIHNRAFHCSDDMGALLGFITDLESHRLASDTLVEGWSWEKIENIRVLHLTTFWMLSVLPLFAFLAIEVSKQRSKSEQTGTGQPTARPVDEPEGGFKPLPEAEGRSR